MSFGILFEVQKFLQELHFLTEKIRLILLDSAYHWGKFLFAKVILEWRKFL